MHFLSAYHVNGKQTFRDFQYIVNRGGKTHQNLRLNDKPVHHDFDCVFDILIEFDFLGQIV